MANLSKGKDAKLQGLLYDGSQLPVEVAFCRAFLPENFIRNGKPVERQGRKAIGPSIMMAAWPPKGSFLWGK